MYAIVEIAGHQYKVEKDQQVFVNRLDAEEGKKVKFDRVLLVDKAGDVTVGAPAIDGMAVHAVVERHLKGDKVLIFKKKRRKGYQKLNGFRASLTEIKITDIKKSAAKKAAPKRKLSLKLKPPQERRPQPRSQQPRSQQPRSQQPKSLRPRSQQPKSLRPRSQQPKACGKKDRKIIQPLGSSTPDTMAHTKSGSEFEERT